MESLSESEKNTALILSEKKSAEKVLLSITEEINTIETDAENILGELSLKLSKFSISEFTLENTENIINQLKNRLDKWQTYNKEKIDSEK